jgi:hypothetical protein
MVSPKLGEEVQRELGDTVLLGFTDERLMSLQSLYFDKNKANPDDPAASKLALETLGAGWTEIHTDPSVSTREFRLQTDKQGDFQDLVFDDYARAVKLSTTDRRPGGMEFEEMWLRSDGNVTRSGFIR